VGVFNPLILNLLKDAPAARRESFFFTVIPVPSLPSFPRHPTVIPAPPYRHSRATLPSFPRHPTVIPA